MRNLFYSDWYRLRKGAAARNTMIGLAVTVLFLVISITTMTSEGMQLFLDDVAGSDIATATEFADLDDAFAQLRDMSPQNAAELGREMLSENFVPFFSLVFIISIFCADFSAGTYRNTLSHESSRTRVYTAKLALSACCLLALDVLTLVFGWIFGGIIKGFAGFGAAYFTQTVVGLLLLFVAQLGVLCFGHCIVAVTRKSSAAIAVYLVTLTVLSIILQTVGLLPSLGWLSLLDWNTVGGVLLNYGNASTLQIVVALAASVVVAAASTAIGIMRYNKTDMA